MAQLIRFTLPFQGLVQALSARLDGRVLRPVEEAPSGFEQGASASPWPTSRFINSRHRPSCC